MRTEKDGNKSKGWYFKNKKYEYVVIDYLDVEDACDFKLLLEFLQEVSKGKPIFMTMSGLDGINENELLNLFQRQKAQDYKAQLSNIDNQIINVKIFENRGICFDIYQSESAMQWYEYIDRKNDMSKKEIKDGKLYISVGLTDETIVELMASPSIQEVDYLVRQLNERGYKIRRFP